MQRENRVKSKLKAGGTVFGTWTICSSPMVANVIAMSGMDFVTIDMEHGPTSFETAESLLYAIEAGGSTPMIRLGEGSEPTILRALEIGTQGLLVSHVSTREEAENIVNACLYAPDGKRGLSAFIRRHNYSDENLGIKLKEANEQILAGVLVEGEEGIKNLNEISEISKLDLIYLGIYDISQVVGVPGELNNPKVVELVSKCVKIIEDHGVAAGAVARDRDHIQFLIEAGFRYISYLVDTAIIKDGFDEARSWYEQVAK